MARQCGRLQTGRQNTRNGAARHGGGGGLETTPAGDWRPAQIASFILNPAVPGVKSRYHLYPQGFTNKALVTRKVICGAVGSEANKGRVCVGSDRTAGFRFMRQSLLLFSIVHPQAASPEAGRSPSRVPRPMSGRWSSRNALVPQPAIPRIRRNAGLSESESQAKLQLDQPGAGCSVHSSEVGAGYVRGDTRQVRVVERVQHVRAEL